MIDYILFVIPKVLSLLLVASIATPAYFELEQMLCHGTVAELHR